MVKVKGQGHQVKNVFWLSYSYLSDPIQTLAYVVPLCGVTLMMSIGQKRQSAVPEPTGKTQYRLCGTLHWMTPTRNDPERSLFDLDSCIRCKVPQNLHSMFFTGVAEPQVWGIWWHQKLLLCFYLCREKNIHVSRINLTDRAKISFWSCFL